MATIVSAARSYATVDREILYVNAVLGLAVVAAALLHAHYGSFARALAAVGLSPVA